jgi:outer membrane lipoprotein LolB
MRTLIVTLLLLLTACSSTPPRPRVADPQMAWQEHQYHLAGLRDWSLSGRLAIQSGNEGWQVSINWEQKHDDYSILLIAPLGQGSLRLSGNTDAVTLTTDEGESLADTDPGSLLYRQFGWRVPVKSLRYWVLGIPAPGKREENIDDYGRLAHLVQDGWDIRFLDYQNREGQELPGRVFVTNHQAKVKLVISNWELNTSL